MATRSRRTTRRTAIVDSDDEISNTSIASSSATKIHDDEEDEFAQDTSQTSQTSRRSTRAGRKSSAPAADPAPAPAPRRRGRPRKTPEPEPEPELEADIEDVTTKVADDVDASAADVTAVKEEEQDENMNATQIPATTPQATPKKRTSTAGPRASMASANLAPPTPQTTISPEAQRTLAVPATPLADITTNTINAPFRDDPMTTVRANKFNRSIMDQPLDVMIKSRTMTTIPFVEETTPKSRTVLKYLILNNFKSYAGRQEVGPFHASFSSVVGPNGSGKSNVIDSLLFVFGFRASKMRQGKISALIHNSAEFPNLDHCEVAVHFEEVMDKPGGGSEVVPNSQLIISRKAFKNNSSSYYIDGKTSNFTAVTTLLKDRGVDLDHKRFLILQGEVESIAQMKPKAPNEHDDGLLEYLEDIIGTSKYKTPIEESATEVETLNEVCAEKNGRVQHVEKEKNSLEDKKDKALAFMRDENDLAMKQSALYQLFTHECHDNLAVTQEAINQMQSQLDAELEKHQGGEQQIKDLEKQYAQGNKSFAEQEKQTQALTKEMSKFEQERVKFDEKRKFLETKKEKLEKTIANAESTKDEADRTIEESTEEIETRSAQVAELEEQVKVEEAELATIRDSLKGKTQKYSDQIAAKQRSLEPWNEKISQKESAIAVAESEMKLLEEKANAGAVAAEELKGKIAAAEEDMKSKKKQIKVCDKEKAELLEEADKMKSELSVLAEQEPKMRAKISNARQKADEARSSLASGQARGNVVTALMRMKDSGRIDGFHGRLGNLGTIDSKYDVAISTACPQLDNFVTETVEAGQQCIEHLRKNNLGRGNFICLDKMRSRDMSSIKTPEDAPRLFDLITAKEDRFLPAFYHALQDTLVASDLAQANRIAYGAKRWRVVTLAGELIDKSGTMSGGGNVAKKGLMSSKQTLDVTKEQVVKLEEDRDSWEAKYIDFQEYQRECETRLREIDEQVPQLDIKVQKINLELESMSRSVTDLHRRAKELAKEHQPSASDDSRAESLKSEVAKLTKEIEKLHGETASVEEEIKALQDKIMEVGGEKLRAQRAKVDGIKEEIAEHQEQISNAEVRRVKAEKQKVKLDKDHVKASKDMAAADKDLEKLDHDIANQDEKAEELRARVAEAEEALGNTKAELKALKSELDEKTAELNETRALEIEMKNKLEDNHKALTENQRRLKYWEDKLSKLELHNIEDLVGGPEGMRKKPEAAPTAQDPADGDEEMADASTEDAQTKANEDLESDPEPAEASTDNVEMTDAPAEEAAEAEDDDGPAHDPQQFPRYTPDELADMSKEQLKGEIAALEEKVQNVNVDLGVLAEYRRRVEEYAARSSDLQSALEQRDSAKKRCDDLRRLRLEGFMEGLGAISLRLKEMYQLITMGGNAELELVDSLDPFSEGIQFSVMPPKKSWKNISNLSGGEKTLSSLALVFALHHYKPTPLYVMDEIDAALDFRNVSTCPALGCPRQPPRHRFPFLDEDRADLSIYNRFPLWRITSRSAQRTRSSSSSPSETTCSS